MPKNLVAWVGLALALMGLLGSAVSSLIQIKTDIAEIRAEMKYLHGTFDVPKGH
jgi:hypothetical protein